MFDWRPHPLPAMTEHSVSAALTTSSCSSCALQFPTKFKTSAGLRCRFEKVTVYHSWNANWLFTNSIVFSLQRHSDHHENAQKPYQVRPAWP